jgi:predicted NAD/FAD-dependent oxidoreductase
MQGSLLRHGELHNNLRMTWAKAIPYWTRDPQHALQQLITLNHRYALDGSDPNSYGGLLWTLGLFERPFDDQPVTGRLRTRSTHGHAKRLDLAHYRARVRRPGSGDVLNVAVIGAGLSGLAAARTLQDQGHEVTVFEKSRGPGGRAATRRYDEIGFDHGAQYFTARDPGFREAVEAWQQVGVVAPWQARLATYAAGKLNASPDDQVRYVGLPGMNALGKYLANDLTVLKTTRVAPPRFEHGQWSLRTDNDEALGRFDALVVAAPAPQAAELLMPSAPTLAEIAAGVTYDPTWAAMLFIDDPDPVGFDGLFIKDGPLRWAARNHSKPGRQGQTWVAHAGPDWTRDHLGQSRDEIGGLLAHALANVLDLPPEQVKLMAAHSWLYSLVPEPLNQGALWDGDKRLAVCGDWCQGARVEGAYLSGIAAAGRLMGHQYSTEPAHSLLIEDRH